MKKIVLISILFKLFLFTNTEGQDSTYYKYKAFIKKAEENGASKKTKIALSYYDSAFNIIDYIPYTYYDAFSLAISDSNYFRAKEYLVKGALKGLDLSAWNSPEIGLFNNSKFAKEYWIIKDSLLRIHFKSIDIEYYNALEDLKKLDQSKRGNNSEADINDSLNFDKLIILSKNKGFPTYKTTGYGHNNAWLILWHNKNKYPVSLQWQQIIPLINNEILKGTIDPDFFKKIEDMKKRIK
ncbi:MAG: hypothetical protein WCL51_14440 [Bacteroidota bacterium]